MCLTPTHTHAKRAKEDIIVFKVFKQNKDGSLHSPWKPRLYAQRGKFFAKIRRERPDRGTIGPGLHAWQRRSGAVCAAQNYARWKGVRYGGPCRVVVRRMVIPAGTKYFRGDEGDIVAEELRWYGRRENMWVQFSW